MLVTKDRMARDLAEVTGYYLKDVKTLLAAMDDVVKGYFTEVTDDEEVVVQIIEGVKLKSYVVQPRERINPKTREPIVVKATVKPGVKYSQDFRALIQQKYEEKKAE